MMSSGMGFCLPYAGLAIHGGIDSIQMAANSNGGKDQKQICSSIPCGAQHSQVHTGGLA
jgi:hypothetical protein